MVVDYDAVVLGAGLGGIAAALTLRRQGASVLVVERRRHVGGRCQTIPVDGCLLPTGTVVIPRGDFLEGLFVEEGVAFDVEPLVSRGVYEVDGRLIAVPDRGALRTLADAALPGRQADADALMAAVRRGLGGEDPGPDVTMHDWLVELTDSPVLWGTFQALAGAYLATNSYEVTARAFFAYLRGAAGAAGIGIPRRGWGALVEPLGDRVQERGGALWLEAQVRALTVTDGRVDGVVVHRQGEDVTVRAGVVISDVGPHATLALLPPDVDLGGFGETVRRVPSSPGVALFFHHREDLVEAGGPLLPASAQRACFVITPTALAPALGDGSSHWSEVLVTLEDSRVQTPAAAAAATAQALLDVHRLFPQLDGVAPFKRIVYRGDWPIYRAWPGWDLETWTPIPNLLLAGDAVKPTDVNGTSAAASSGRHAAEQALAFLAGSGEPQRSGG